MSMRVFKVEGEATRFHVESNSLICVNAQCSKLYSRLRNSSYRVGMTCPKCGIGKLDVRFHLVDISTHDMNGECSCEFFQFTCKPRLAGMMPHERGLGKARCSHIEAARSFALDVALKVHEIERGKSANGQTEEE